VSFVCHGSPTFCGKRPHPLMWAGFRAACGKVRVSGISTPHNYCVIFIVCTHFTNVAVGRICFCYEHLLTCKRAELSLLTAHFISFRLTLCNYVFRTVHILLVYTGRNVRVFTVGLPQNQLSVIRKRDS
jgi:hypothetical protein